MIAILVLTTTSAHAQKLSIRNLQDDPLLLVKEKDCKIQTGTIRIIHPINLSSIEETAEMLISSSYRNNVQLTNPLTSILRYKTKKLYNNLYQLKPQEHHRSRRWNAIGTVWKWIAGTPDASDLQAINTTMNDLIDQNNQQFKVNQNINNRIQQLTQAIKEITMQAKLNDIMMNDIETTTSILNIDIINQLLEDIQDAIMLSKLSITTNKILSIREILTIKELLQDQGVNIHLPDEALQFVTPKFATSPGTLLYFMHVPLLENTTSSVIRIYPITNENQIISEYPERIIKNGNRIFTTQNPKDYVQKSAYLKDLNDRCVSHLINGRKPECNVIFNNQTTYKLISDNTLLISNVKNQQLESNCGPDNRSLEGNLLINFVNCTININNQSFKNEEYISEPELIDSAFYNLEPAWKIRDNPDLKNIHQNTIQNRRHLEHVYLEQHNLRFKFWTLFGGLSFTYIIILFVVFMVIRNFCELQPQGSRRSLLQGGVVTDRPIQPPGLSNNADHIQQQIQELQQQQNDIAHELQHLQSA